MWREINFSVSRTARWPARSYCVAGKKKKRIEKLYQHLTNMEATFFFFLPLLWLPPTVNGGTRLPVWLYQLAPAAFARRLPPNYGKRPFVPASRGPLCDEPASPNWELGSGAASPAAASHAWVRQEIAAASARDESVRGERTVIRRLTGKERNKNECPRLRLRPVPASQFPAVRGVEHIHTLYFSRKWILM